MLYEKGARLYDGDDRCAFDLGTITLTAYASSPFSHLPYSSVQIFTRASPVSISSLSLVAHCSSFISVANAPRSLFLVLSCLRLLLCASESFVFVIAHAGSTTTLAQPPLSSRQPPVAINCTGQTQMDQMRTARSNCISPPLLQSKHRCHRSTHRCVCLVPRSLSAIAGPPTVCRVLPYATPGTCRSAQQPKHSLLHSTGKSKGRNPVE